MVHAEVTEDRERQSEALSLPTHLVRCFEETVSYVIHSTTSFEVMERKMHYFHTLNDLSKFEQELQQVHSVASQAANLGQAAQKSMYDATKAFMLSDTRKDMVDMANAGPEFLLTLICQNLQQRHVSMNLDLDINELYREYTQRLVRLPPLIILT